MTRNKPSQEYVDATEASREIIRDYVRRALGDGGYPDAHDFTAEYSTPSIRWDTDAVDTEMTRIIPAETLRRDVRDYVGKGGYDAFTFALAYAPRHNRVPGREIQRLIDTEREAVK